MALASAIMVALDQSPSDTAAGRSGVACHDGKRGAHGDQTAHDGQQPVCGIRASLPENTWVREALALPEPLT